MTKNLDELYLEVASKEYDIVRKCVNARKELNLTQEEIIKATGLNKKNINELESFGNEISLTNLLLYIDSLGLRMILTKK
jgi:transcriptional regulator with XRE-family HTH domain